MTAAITPGGSSLAGRGTVTITQWTAYPADKVLTKETITLSGTVSPVLRLSQGERLAASRSAQTLSSPRLAADWSDLFEITNTIAQLLPQLGRQPSFGHQYHQ